ncbi:antitoxin Xre/MbcA/ParS toxin-binding domain-containing protein [Zunongwangia sp. F260]|uniref:Antitoxin Xre/MbcA/ParS toxin-binding domain-containing protein n=2 Tax=Autumnicola TaxID=3160927 RepID=A0ABU3CPQ0_9FLAO|nr:MULTISPECIES: antitoxin Xre/MbcA/ParS toxin-binding domain-containing protein [unclassified Zunongwangia]MDT0648323.1 antitoxin Xre/MbcA/ParS toxin-binding domain-containing protein [Zunongwangia sp. F260]MDT0685904.1 antitoxin Xre/MbcA/ParS toxin-binding domain-containing protein [Zunongwangia sp. F225]
MVLTVDHKKERETVAKWLDLESLSLFKGNSSFAYLKVLKDGLHRNSVNSFIKHSNLTQKQVSRLIHVSERTLQRKSPDKPMDINSSERLIELTRLFYKGIDVFNDKEKFLAWLNRPNKSLGNSNPLDLIETSIGIDLVMDELLRIEHGVFS